jgi:antitoxin MazE
MKPIKTTIRPMGNSQGVIIPKLLLAQVGLEDEAEMIVERGALVLRKPARAARAGWAEFSEKIAAANDDALVMREFANENDAKLVW